MVEILQRMKCVIRVWFSICAKHVPMPLQEIKVIII